MSWCPMMTIMQFGQGWKPSDFYIDLSLSSVTDKALQPLGWWNAFWMFPHTHSLPHLLIPPPLPHHALRASPLRRCPRVNVTRNLPMIPFSVLTVLLSSLKVLRTWWWATKVWVLFLTHLLPPSPTPSSSTYSFLPLSHCLVLNPPHILHRW